MKPQTSGNARSLTTFTPPELTLLRELDKVRAMAGEILGKLGNVPLEVRPDQFAAQIDVSLSTVYDLMNKHGLPFHDYPFGRRIPVEEAKAWCDQWRRP